jgi:hypothetical protein
MRGKAVAAATGAARYSAPSPSAVRRGRRRRGFGLSSSAIGAAAGGAADKAGPGADPMIAGGLAELEARLRPVERLAAHGLIDHRTLAVHGVHLGSADRWRLAEGDAVLVHNPESNANNGVGRREPGHEPAA